MAINQRLRCYGQGKLTVLREPRLGTYQMWASKMPPGGVALEVSSSRAFQTESSILEAAEQYTHSLVRSENSNLSHESRAKGKGEIRKKGP